MSKDQVDIAQFVLNVLLAFFTMALFWQGQSDRRRVAEDRRREQAAKLSMFRHDVKLKLNPNSWQVASTFLEINNDSDAPVTGIMVFQKIPSPVSINEAEPGWKALNLVDDPIPSVLPYIAGGESERIECGPLSSHELELHFTDGAGLSWVKTLEHGALWPKNQYSIRWWSAWYQRLAQLPKVGKIFNWPIEHSIRRCRKTAPKIPLSARFARFLWGHAPGPGPEPDPWRRPFEIPARDWPYQSMIWFAYSQREHSSPTAAKGIFSSQPMAVCHGCCCHSWRNCPGVPVTPGGRVRREIDSCGSYHRNYHQPLRAPNGELPDRFTEVP